MTKPISLHVHKNTAWKRDQHRVSETLVDEAKTIAGRKGVAGFVIVAWDDRGNTTIAADLTADVIPARVVPAYVMQELQSRLIKPAMEMTE